MMTLSKVNRKTADHYQWGDRCDGWHFLSTPALSIIREAMPSGTFEKLHHHPHAQQFFYIIAGTAVLEIEGSEIEIGPDEGIRIPSGMRHKISNRTGGNLEFIVVSEPPSHGDRIQDEE